MNKKFFIHQITIFHHVNEHFIPILYDRVYFNHSTQSTMVDGGIENSSSGTIFIPTDEKLDISIDDYVVEGNFSNILDFDLYEMQKENEVYQVTSIADNRKGNLKHYQIGVSA